MTKETVEELQAERLAYLILSECLSYPTAELLERLRDGSLARAFSEAGFAAASADGARGLALLEAAGETARSSFSAGQALSALETDYCRLFVGPGHLLAAPYESAYLGRPFLEADGDEALDADNSIDARQVLRVREEYRKQNFDVADDAHDLADHVRFELEYVSQLYRLEAEALQQGGCPARRASIAEQRASFIENHLAKWYPLLEAKIIECARTPFYGAVALLVAVLLGQERGGAD